MASYSWRSSGGGTPLETVVSGGYQGPITPAQTSLTWSGLTGNSAGGYRLIARITNGGGASRNYTLQINGGATNLSYIKTFSSGAAPSGASGAAIDLATTNANEIIAIEMRMRYSHSRLRRYMEIDVSQGNGSNFQVHITAQFDDATNEITQIAIVGNGAGAIGVNSEATLYKVAVS